MRIVSCVIWCWILWYSPTCSVKRMGLGEPISLVNANAIVIEDNWFVQKIDHFDPTNNNTWKQVILCWILDKLLLIQYRVNITELRMLKIRNSVVLNMHLIKVYYYWKSIFSLCFTLHTNNSKIYVSLYFQRTKST